jgi:hypothetical protein
MHRLHSTSSIYRFRFAAFLLCACCVLAPAAAGLIIQALITNDRPLAVIGIALLGGTFLFAILQWMFATRTSCPLCMTPVLAPRKCVTHRKTQTLLGSYRLRVALSVLLKNSFQCPYCAESTAIKVRNKSRRSARNSRRSRS